MKSHLLLTFGFGTLVLALAATASAQNGNQCSPGHVAGDWGYTKTGTLFLPTGPAPFATMGKLTLDANGALSGVSNGSVAGSFSRDELLGTFAVGHDCTGVATIYVYSQSGLLLRTLEMALVLDDDERQLRGIVTRLELPNGATLPTVITAEARKMSRDEK